MPHRITSHHNASRPVASDHVTHWGKGGSPKSVRIPVMKAETTAADQEGNRPRKLALLRSHAPVLRFLADDDND